MVGWERGQGLPPLKPWGPWAQGPLPADPSFKEAAPGLSSKNREIITGPAYIHLEFTASRFVVASAPVIETGTRLTGCSCAQQTNRL